MLLDNRLFSYHRLVVVENDVATVDESVGPAGHDYCLRRLRRALLANYRRHRRCDLLHGDAGRLVEHDLLRRKWLVECSSIEPSSEHIFQAVLGSILSNYLIMVTQNTIF